MGRSRRRAKRRLYKKIIHIILLAIITLAIINYTLARYSSSGKSTANVDVAFYLLEEQTISKTIALEKIEPGEKKTYTFEVANNNGTKRSEIALSYTIELKVTTNLPLEYSLYLNDDTENLLNDINLEKDITGVYYKVMDLPETTFGITSNEENIYTLEISFPSKYNYIQYQGIVEALDITIDAKQLIL